MKRISRVTFLTKVLVTLVSISGESNAAIILQLDVTSSNTISVMASGTLDGPLPAVDQNLLWIGVDSPIGMPADSFSRSGVFQVGGDNVVSSHVGLVNTPYSNSIQMRTNFNLSAGDDVDFNGVFTSFFDHDLTNSSLDDAEIYWGHNNSNQLGVLQGRVSVVPESSIVQLWGLFSLAVIGIRRRSNRPNKT